MKKTFRHLIRGAGTIFDIFPPPMSNPSARARMEAVWKQTGDLLYDAIGQFAAENELSSPEDVIAGKPVRRVHGTSKQSRAREG